jgi:hypothetical protein
LLTIPTQNRGQNGKKHHQPKQREQQGKKQGKSSQLRENEAKKRPSVTDSLKNTLVAGVGIEPTASRL